ncbi:hypothetical protein [Branchiibius cervicis]|uniref:SMI1/KNR4 family protein n=1 Tax=Branchiibius cervicis TaxID=908252 RepID=A0ABW2AQT6_9MICO
MILPAVDLPANFWFPLGYIRVVENDLVALEPWWIIDGKAMMDRWDGLKRRYPHRNVLPFALRQDNDDIACWDFNLGNEVVVIIHDYAQPGYEQRGEYPTFYDWFRSAIEEFIFFGEPLPTQSA